MEVFDDSTTEQKPSKIPRLEAAHQNSSPLSDSCADVEQKLQEEKDKSDGEAPLLCEWKQLELNFEKRRHFKHDKGNPLPSKLQEARDEWLARFMAHNGQDSGVPAVLVAIGVAKWKPAESDTTSYIFTKDGELFVRKVPNPVHGAVHGSVSGDVRVWLQGNNAHFLVDVRDAARVLTSTGAQIEPDILVMPVYGWDANDSPKARGMIEIEYRHRGPSDSRQQGFVFMNATHFHRFFMVIRIYPKRPDGTFAAACVIWRKTTVHALAVATPAPAGPIPPPHYVLGPAIAGPTIAASPIANAAHAAPTVGGIANGVGYDFGTAPMSPVAKTGFTAPLGAGYLPPVVFGPHLGGWTPAPAINALFQAQIPPMDVLYLVRDDNAQLVFPNPINPLTINLGLLQFKLKPLAFDDVHEA